MKKNKILFLHGDIFDMNSERDKIKYFIEFFNLSSKYDINDFVWEEKEPDLLFVSEHLYYGKNTNLVKKKFFEVQSHNPINIFIAGECIEPDLNIFDYAIVFDRNFVCNDRIVRLPFFIKFYKSIFENRNKIKTLTAAEKELNKKCKFCNFIYSNSNAHPKRDQLFYEISKYKKVDSLGSHLTNVNEFDPKIIMIEDWRLQSIKYKEPYKFSIASENASYPGYISEKIITSFQAHTIPIYFGDPEIAKEFNSKAFINYHDYNSFDDMVEDIKKIDLNDKLWMQMIKEPWITSEQEKVHKSLEKEYYKFFNKLFNSNKKELYRKSEGFHPANYRNNFEKQLYKSIINENNYDIVVKNENSFVKRIRRIIIPYKLRAIILKLKQKIHK